MAEADVRRTIEAVWRIESARLIAGAARLVRDVGLAEDLAQEALVAALEDWPESGVPKNPGAWLMATAKHRGIDRLRRADVHQRKIEELGREAEIHPQKTAEPDADDPFDDDLLRLVFIACHPVISTEARVALTLRLLCGLTTREIARAYLVSESTVAQRIVRAKRTLSAARVPFEIPARGELRERVASVLEVIYLIFNEGYSATSGDTVIRPELMEEALRLGRILAELLPREAEVHGLVALMELQASRTRARISPSGGQVLLLDQDRSRWDWLLVGRGLAALERAYATGGPIGPYTLQAGIAACHSRARAAEDTDWERIVALYDGLAQLMPSPVVELNRAVAIGMAFGPRAALEVVETLREDPALDGYYLLPTVRGDLLEKLGRHAEAAAEFERAALLTANTRQRAALLERAAACHT
ncbi:RNA polymerase ECF family sigma subunit [Pseudonocardia hierapolitana]|uniref:RNA polymerase ECF family sigma subunit n=1 Tax=Pseudonocardia hierapolitana TaxID=1128676 RepID=A0A561SSN4_9PSEU|nr:RNA polymerase sigma factor [Pseudonocardia hierapolitana]TWF77878.1 RNA polymerase ECF family sigma subunit [Pseudonocardia hierapolitana]